MWKQNINIGNENYDKVKSVAKQTCVGKVKYSAKMWL